jgi:uncharacterized protein YkwD
MVISGRRRSRPREALLVALAAAIAACDEPGAEPVDVPQPATSITLPSDDACDDVRQWPKARREREAQMLEAIARVRNDGGTCPDTRRFDAALATQTEGALVCAARNFALYLEEFDVIGHDDGDGNTVVDRLADAGWDTLLATQLVAAADVEPDSVVDEVWLRSAPHCDALRASAWTHVGVGYIENEVPVDPNPDDPTLYGGYWVVVLSTAAR